MPETPRCTLSHVAGGNGFVAGGWQGAAVPILALVLSVPSMEGAPG